MMKKLAFVLSLALALSSGAASAAGTASASQTSGSAWSGEWGGADKSRTKTFHPTDGGVYGRDYTLAIDLPAMGSRLFRLSPEALHPEAAQASAALALNQKRKAARAAKAPASKSKK